MRIQNKMIITQLNWILIQQMIQLSSVKVLNNIIQTEEPEDLYNLLRILKRKTAQMGLKKYLKKSKLSKSPICQALKSYNELPDKVKVKDKEKFKSTVNKYFKTSYKLEPDAVCVRQSKGEHVRSAAPAVDRSSSQQPPRAAHYINQVWQL